jgi:hypothetical protein
VKAGDSGIQPREIRGGFALCRKLYEGYSSHCQLRYKWEMMVPLRRSTPSFISFQSRLLLPGSVLISRQVSIDLLASREVKFSVWMLRRACLL